MNKLIDLSIVIVSYNTSDLLIDCLHSIIKATKKYSYEIIVVDNASSDDTVEKIQNSKFKIQNDSSKLKIIQNKENYGFSKANNIGIKSARGRYVLFLNPDTLIYDNTIDGMMHFMDEQYDAGASTCFVRLPNGQPDDAAHRGFPTPWRAFCHFTYLSKMFHNKLFSGYDLSYLDKKEIHEIDACAGAFMLVRREAGEQIKWWDEDYFWYGEDLDFCYKLKQYGWKIYFVPNFEILHYKGVSGGIKDISKHLTKASKETREKATDSRFMAMKIFYDKNFKDKYPPFVNSLVIMGINTRWRISRILNRL